MDSVIHERLMEAGNLRNWCFHECFHWINKNFILVLTGVDVSLRLSKFQVKSGTSYIIISVDLKILEKSTEFEKFMTENQD